MGVSGKTAAPRRRYVRFTRWRRAHFFRVLEETGHAQMAAEAAGVSLGCIYRLRRLEPGFTEKMAAAVAEADRRLEAQEEGQSRVTVPGDCPRQQALVIRRGIGGRLRVMAAGKRWWTERHDAVFLDHLRSTGNVAAAARAAGFTPKSAWNRRDRLAGFSQAMDEAREEADLELLFRLAAHAGSKRGDDFEPPPRFDPEQAMRALSFRDNRGRGKHSPRLRPAPSIEAVGERIERLVRAVRRHGGGQRRPGGADESDSHQ